MKNDGVDEEFEGFEADDDDDLNVMLNDQTREELDELVGLKVVGLELWEESLGDEEGAPPKPEERVFFDCDLLMEENLALELYVTSAYPDPEGEPLSGTDAIYEAVGKLSDDKLELLDFDQADEEGGLALAFGHGDKPEMVLVCSAWLVSEWEEDESGEGESQEA